MEGKAITGGGKVGKQGKFQWGSAGNVLWEELNMRDLAYLRLLAREYPNVQAASSEIINLMAILMLSPIAFALFKDYDAQLKAGKEPVFDPSQFPKLANKVDPKAWPKKP